MRVREKREEDAGSKGGKVTCWSSLSLYQIHESSSWVLAEPGKAGPFSLWPGSLTHVHPRFSPTLLTNFYTFFFLGKLSNRQLHSLCEKQKIKQLNSLSLSLSLSIYIHKIRKTYNRAFWVDQLKLLNICGLCMFTRLYGSCILNCSRTQYKSKSMFNFKKDIRLPWTCFLFFFLSVYLILKIMSIVFLAVY